MIARPYKVRKELAVRFGLALLLLKPVIGPSLQELSVRVNGVPTMTRAEDSLRSRARSCRPNRLIINLQVCPVGYTGAQGIAGGPTEVTEVSGTGIELVPNLNGVLGGVLRPYRAVRMASVGYLPNKYPQYTWYVPYRTHLTTSHFSFLRRPFGIPKIITLWCIRYW